MNNDQHYTFVGEGAPLVFQHGLGANLQQSVDLMGNLPGFRLIASDSPGHGKSALTSKQPSFNNYADAVVELLDYLDIERAVIGGISMGAGIALNIAIRHPNRVHALILVRPAWLNEALPDNLKILNLIARYVRENLNLDYFTSEPEFGKIAKRSKSASLSILKQLESNNLDSARIILEGMIEDHPFQSMKELEKCQIPSLVVGNQADPLHPIEMAQEIGRYLPNGDFKEVASRYLNDARHRKEVRALAIDFLGRELVNLRP